MLVLGIILIILGIVGKIFSSVSHITDTTAKAMGWIVLNKVVAIVSILLIIFGIVAILFSFF